MVKTLNHHLNLSTLSDSVSVSDRVFRILRLSDRKWFDQTTGTTSTKEEQRSVVLCDLQSNTEVTTMSKFRKPISTVGGLKGLQFHRKIKYSSDTSLVVTLVNV